MGKVIAGMTVSLDGFVNDSSGSAAALYPDLAALQGTDFMNDVVAQTGAVLMGRRTFEMGDADSFVGNYEFQVPIFVVTHQPPAVMPKQDENLTFTFVADGVESAVAQAKAAAGGNAVQVVGGVDLISQLLARGLVDEINLDVMPVLLGAGRRFFGDELAGIGLEKIGVREQGQRTSFSFRVKGEA